MSDPTRHPLPSADPVDCVIDAMERPGPDLLARLDAQQSAARELRARLAACRRLEPCEVEAPRWECSTCNGTGQTPQTREPTLYDPDDGSDPCPRCPTCPNCGEVVYQQPQPQEIDGRWVCCDSRCLAEATTDPEVTIEMLTDGLDEMLAKGQPAHPDVVYHYCEALSRVWRRVAEEIER